MGDEPIYDPREGVHPIVEGQVYADDRTGDPYRAIHVDDHVVLLRYDAEDEYSHMVTNRQQFEREIGAGRFKLTETAPDPPRMPDKLDEIRAIIRRKYDEYGAVGSRTGKHKAEAMSELYDELGALTQTEDDFDFEAVPGIGAGTAENLRDAGIRTAMDVKRVGKETLLSIGGMGEKNTEALLEAVD